MQLHNGASKACHSCKWVLCKTVNIALMISTLNNLEVKAVNILNVHVIALVMEKMWSLGSMKAMLPLYTFSIQIFSSRKHAQYGSMQDLNLSHRPMIRPVDDTKHCTYILHHIDGNICIHPCRLCSVIIEFILFSNQAMGSQTCTLLLCIMQMKNGM